MKRLWKGSAKRTAPLVVSTLMVLLILNACAAGSTPVGAEPAPNTPTNAPTTGPPTGSVEGVVVRFRSGQASIDVTLGTENPTNRALLAMLPFTTSVREFNGKEKIAELPRDLTTEGSPGSDPADGDLIYYVPWGSLGFYYDASGIGFSGQTIHVGTFEATGAELSGLEGSNVTVEVVG